MPPRFQEARDTASVEHTLNIPVQRMFLADPASYRCSTFLLLLLFRVPLRLLLPDPLEPHLLLYYLRDFYYNLCDSSHNPRCY